MEPTTERPERPRAGLRRPGIALAVLLLAAVPAGAQLPPDAAWRTLETPHFRVTYAPGLEELAREAAERAETARARLRERFMRPPEGPIEIVVTDNADFANGFATVIPDNRIVVFAHPPVDNFSLAYYRDWLDLVITHELAHIVHLDDSGGVGSVLREIFGRVPAEWPFFPGRSSPRWTIEGIATYYESALTGAGRVHGTFHEMILRTAALEGRFEEIDEASGSSPVWPDGLRPYTYGSRFFDHLLERYGEDRMGRFVDAFSGQLIPFRMNAAAGTAFGVPFERAWRDWADSLRTRYRALADTLAARAPLTAPQPVSHAGRLARFPRWSPGGERLAFSASDGRSDPQIRVVGPAGGAPRKGARLNQVSSFDWAPGGGWVAEQIDFIDPYHLRKDLYRMGDGGPDRITRASRLYHPDVHPSGGSAVAVQDGGGTNRLVRVTLAGGRVTPLVPFREGVHWAFPRWSPDGSRIAASRWRDGRYDVVVVDSSGRVVVEVTRDRAVDATPAWSPDGRWLVWSSDRSGIANLQARRMEGEGAGEVRQLTNLLTGAYYPDVSPDGRWLAFAGYHADGWRIERIPFDPGAGFEPFPPRIGGDEEPVTSGAGRESPPVDASSGEAVRDGPYRPLRTLWPRFWLPWFRDGETILDRPVVGDGWGIATRGWDLVGRHAYAARAAVGTEAARVSGVLRYAYRGLGNPVLGFTASQFHDARGVTFVRVEGREEPDTLLVVERDRSFSASASLLRPRFRSSGSLTLSLGLVRESRELLELDLSETERELRSTTGSPLRLDRTLGEAALTARWTNRRRRPFGISAEDGVGLLGRIRRREDLDVPAGGEGAPETTLQGEGSFTEAVGELTGYLSFPLAGFADHVLAVRASGGWAEGPGADAFHFDLGGARGGLDAGIVGLGAPGPGFILFPVRGYGTSDRRGSAAWSASVEYRFPLALVHEGIGLWPLHVDRVSGALFADAGHAWGPDETPVAGIQGRTVLGSVGAEVTARVLPLWAGVIDLRVGGALPLTRIRGERSPSVYLRIGRSF